MLLIYLWKVPKYGDPYKNCKVIEFYPTCSAFYVTPSLPVLLKYNLKNPIEKIGVIKSGWAEKSLTKCKNACVLLILFGGLT